MLYYELAHSSRLGAGKKLPPCQAALPGATRHWASFPRQKALMISRTSTFPSAQSITEEAIILLLITISVAKLIDKEYVLMFFNKENKTKNTTNIEKQ